MKHEISNRLAKVDNKALFGDPRAISLISTQRRLPSTVDFPQRNGLKHFHLLQIRPIQPLTSFSGAYSIRETCAKLAPLSTLENIPPKDCIQGLLHRNLTSGKREE